MAVTSTGDLPADGAGFTADGAGCGAAEGAEATACRAVGAGACAGSGVFAPDLAKSPGLPKPPELRDRI